MATTLNFKDYLDVPLWRPESPSAAASAAGSSLAWDMRNSMYRHPYIYQLTNATTFSLIDPTTGDILPLASPALTGTFGAGACAVFDPSKGPRGTLAAGATTSKVVLSTALPAAVAINQLANRGDGIGFRIRICGLAAGKTEERTIVSNTAGTTPSVFVDQAFSFTPAANDLYEIRAGRVWLLSAGTLASGMWKYYDVATNSVSAALTTTNMPATVGTDSNLVPLSEDHVPYDRQPGEGFIPGGTTSNGGLYNAIQATAVTNTTNAVVTGSGMPADLQASEYVNFQVRIVEDATTPGAVGQRKKITGHTGGATGAFTLSGVFTTAPSNNAKFVVENDDDKVIMFSSAATAVYNYNVTANTWDTSTWATAAANGAGNVAFQGFGPTRDTTNNHRHSFIYRVRGGAGNQIDVLDIAGGATGVWSNDIAYGNKSQTYTTGTCGAYCPATLGGRFIHINVNGTQRFVRFDVRNRVMDTSTYMRFPQGAALVGAKMAAGTFMDGASKADVVYHWTNTQTQILSLVVQR